MMKIEVLLFLIIIVLETIHFFERRDLYNRLMADSLTEYKQDKKPTGSVKNFIKKNMDKRYGGGTDEG